ncbi:M14 family metallopeptidase [Stenotrophomonas maltophilia]|uniref:M14 family metallopeptidase n=1 Tax=Stenotrophomonas maltophilia TaxID=40324 RepID=UPI001C0E91C7|nr:M14 family metallopeptidase [Stenotrophomonas maltophilia]
MTTLSVPRGWETPIELSGFEQSPNYADTVAFLHRLDHHSPIVSIRSFGTSTQGQDLVYAKVSKGGRKRPVVLIQGGIHAGEIDGKDAGMMLLRDIVAGARSDLIDEVDIVFVPVLNADAHENASDDGRPTQRGPLAKGARTNSQGLDLNRDYARLESAEISAVVKLLQQYDPELYVDVHVSDGTDYQYDITYAFAGWGTYARSRQTAEWLMGPYSRDLQASLTAAGHVPGIYPSWVDENAPSQGLRIAMEAPRYSTGYGDFIGVPTVLVETHTFKPYRQRVLGTYALLVQSLRSVARDADRIAAAKKADRSERAPSLAVAWERDPVPLEVRPFQGYRYETYESAASGARELKWTGKPVQVQMPVYGTRVTQTAAIPQAWWIPIGNDRIVELLKSHGVTFERIVQPKRVTLEQRYMATGQSRETVHSAQEETLMPTGSIRVSANQPLRLLAAALLEPSSQDSVLAMGWFDRSLPSESSLPRHVLAPMADAMMESDVSARRAFEQALAADESFAADPMARLRWWEARSPYQRRAWWRYPILVERR